MQNIIYGIITGVLISLTAYSVGYMWQTGKNTAVKTRKVCDVCFRDIQRLRNALDAKKSTDTAEPSE